jgi:hypothetical protein
MPGIEKRGRARNLVEDVDELVLDGVDRTVLYKLRVRDAEPINEAGLAERVATVGDATLDIRQRGKGDCMSTFGRWKRRGWHMTYT